MNGMIIDEYIKDGLNKLEIEYTIEDNRLEVNDWDNFLFYTRDYIKSLL